MRRSHHPTSTSARRWCTRFAALLAVFLQVFVVQTHIHALTPISAAGYERTADTVAAVSHIEGAYHAQVACALCRAQASSRVVPPSAAAIGAAEAAPLHQPAVESQLAAVAASHSWQSRAPPTHL